MTDRELLEMAAKAAGYNVRWNENWKCFVHVGPHNIDNPPTPAGERHAWVPLNDDGDALRLAVKLNMLCDFGSHGVLIEAKNGHGPCTEVGDYRRAIVRAAAEIGKNIGQQS